MSDKNLIIRSISVELFDVVENNITYYLQNIFKSSELEKISHSKN